MNRFLKIFETALKNQTVTGEDVNEVLSKLKDEAMAPGSLTSGDSTLVPLRDDEVSEDSTTAAVAGFNSPKAFQPNDGQELVIAKMLADAIQKTLAKFGDDATTFDNLEEFRSTFAEKRRLKEYPRRKERFGRDPLGANSRKPDSLDEEAEQTPVDPEELKMGVEVEKEHTTDLKLATQIATDHLKEDPRYYSKLKQCMGLPKDETGALAAPRTIGRIAVGKIVQE